MIELDDVLACGRGELILRWRTTFGSSPSKHTSTLFMQKVLSYEVQCEANGDVLKRTRKVLNAALHSGRLTSHPARKMPDLNDPLNCAPTAAPDVRIGTSAILSPGVRLVREWNGRTWHVEVLEDGFSCRGKTYRSLSAIARMITGTRWSGPRFFGLTR